jgi:hypothetical protein
MPILEVQPLVLKDVELLIGGLDDFRKHVSGVTFTPSSSQTTWSGLGLNTHTDSGIPTWTVTLDYVQDWTSTTSLSAYLFEHEGETVAIEFTPTDGVGPAFTANVSIVPGAIGGTVNAFATTSVTLGSDKPVRVPPVAADEDVVDDTDRDTDADAYGADDFAADPEQSDVRQAQTAAA